MKRIVGTLYFQGIYDREEEIKTAHNSTFEWICNEPTANSRPWDSFIAWLAGDGMTYWINGKPASGKSTLMRFLFRQPKTQVAVERWAGTKVQSSQGQFSAANFTEDDSSDHTGPRES
jgi:hypothetical protein